MAKKEEKKTKDTGAKKTTRTGKKNSEAKGKALETPETSGQVKGPMGVGGKEKPDEKAKEKKPAKITQPTEKDASGKKKKAAGTKKAATTKKTATEKGESASEPKSLPKTEKKSLPKPKKALPEETTATEETTAGAEKKKTARKTTTRKKAASTEDASRSDKPAKFKEPLTDEEVPPKAAPATKRTTSPTEETPEAKKTAPKAAKTRATAARKSTKTSAKKSTAEEETEKKAPAKKMSRKKKVEGISAEEKMKMPNTSTTDDLKETAKSTAKDLADKVTPDEETQENLKNIAKEVLPDANDIKETAGKIADTVAPDPEKAREMMDKIIPGQEDVKEAAEKAKKTSKTTAKEKQEKQEKQKSAAEKPVEATLLTDYDVHLFKEGKHYHLYKKFGSHLMEYMGTEGVYFALWAPNAKEVSVIGDFNNWSREAHPMKPRLDQSGIWEVFIPQAQKGSLYKYFIRSNNGYEVEKGDPFAFMWETPPDTASIVWDLENTWSDKDWMEERRKKVGQPQPYSVYELHLGSWKRVPEEGFRSLSYKEMAEDLPGYLKDMGFTHVEFMPVMEHPFFGSWGYQITGYFAPSSRFGTPQDFMDLIDSLHQAGIGVILDWVPSHFPSDMHGLHYFDGTFLYEHADPRKGFHPDWQSYIFNYGRNEVRSFLISNSLYWLDRFHIDGLRVDAVASMLYLDYSRKEGEWEPNEFGGNENLEAISFLKEFNEVVYGEFPDVVTIAEESTAWPMVSKPTYIGGLGFGMKWMMGWMHDTLEYFSKDPIHRRHHQNTITFSSNYAFTENFMLPLSHDEVVYGKHSILNKMPGDHWNKFANLRTLYSYMYAHPGTKLLFMGSEFGQPSEWDHDGSLEWHLTNEEPHRQIQETLKQLNHVYRTEPAFYEKSFDSEGFEWVDFMDAENSIISFLRKGSDRKDDILVVCNFTPVPRENYRIGVPEEGSWKEIFNSDDANLGGSNVKNEKAVDTQDLPAHHKNVSVSLTLPPMAVIYLKRA